MLEAVLVWRSFDVAGWEDLAQLVLFLLQPESFSHDSQDANFASG